MFKYVGRVNKLLFFFHVFTLSITWNNLIKMGWLMFYLGKLDLKEAFEIWAIQFSWVVTMWWLCECVEKMIAYNPGSLVSLHSQGSEDPSQYHTVFFFFFFTYFLKLFLVFKVWLNKGSYTSGAVWCKAYTCGVQKCWTR